MKALTFNGPQSIKYESVADPTVERTTDALIQVGLTAICGSDLHLYHEREKGLDHGTVMGHEFVGEVVEVGSEVSRLRPGDRVLSPFSTSCGSCFYCNRGLTSRCSAGQLFGWVSQGRGLQGAQAEFVRVPLAESTLLAIPEDISDAEALLLGDIFSTAFYCAERAEIEPDGVYVVLGCGPVGLLAILAVRERSARRVFAIDSIPERLAQARRFGAETIDYTQQEPLQIVLDATEGRGADGVLEIVGSEAAHRLAAELVRAGGTISVVGVHNEAGFGFPPALAYDKNLTYRVGRCPARQLIPRLIPLVRQKRYDIESVISHRWRLQEGPRGYELFDLKQDGCTKVALQPER